MKKIKKTCGDPSCCVQPGSISNPEINTSFKSRHRLELWLDKYNHIMEFARTILAITTIILQLYIIAKLIN